MISRRAQTDSESLARDSVFAGRFRIRKELGRGGMGVVYEAIDQNAKRNVALKVIARKYADDPEFVERFQREGQAIANLEHHNIVPVYEVNTTKAGQWYLVMKLLHGSNLRALLDHQPGRSISLLYGARVGIQVADALRLAHSTSTWHRDVKPENIFVGNQGNDKGRVWLLDFGLAKRADTSAHTDEQRQMGTYRYLSPEQIRGKSRPDGRADLYALGCVLFEMWTGESALDAVNDAQASVTELLAAHVYGEPRRLRDALPGAPARADRLVANLLAKEPERRPQTAEEVGLELYELIVELVGASHPAAVKSARPSADASGEWPVAFGEAGGGRADKTGPGAGGSRRADARPASTETAPLPLSFTPGAAGPVWLVRPHARPANDPALESTARVVAPAGVRSPGVSVTAGGTVRILPAIQEAAIAAADRRLAAAEAAPAQPAPESTGTSPLPTSGPRTLRSQDAPASGMVPVTPAPSAEPTNGDPARNAFTAPVPPVVSTAPVPPVVSTAPVPPVVSTAPVPPVVSTATPATPAPAAPPMAANGPPAATTAAGEELGPEEAVDPRCVAPVPTPEQLGKLWAAALSKEEEARVAHIAEPHERKHALLLLRYLASQPPHVTHVHTGVDVAVDRYLRSIELPEDSPESDGGAAPETAGVPAPGAKEEVRKPGRRLLRLGLLGVGILATAFAAGTGLRLSLPASTPDPKAAEAGVTPPPGASTGAAAASGSGAAPAGSSAAPSAATARTTAPSATTAASATTVAPTAAPPPKPVTTGAATAAPTGLSKTWKRKPAPCPPELVCDDDFLLPKKPAANPCGTVFFCPEPDPPKEPPRRKKLPTNPSPPLSKPKY